jgi:DNA-binding transcriptional LysR family regulator
MNPRHLEFVIAAAELKSFTKAAKATHVSQPSLSQAIAGIEDQVGARLFIRHGRTVSLTASGEAFVETARIVLRNLQALHDSVKSVEGLEAGHLDIAAPHAPAAELLAEIVGEFRVRFPGIRIRIQTSESLHEIERMVRSAEVELAFTTQPVQRPLIAKKIATQDILVILPPNTKLERRPVRHEDLAGMPLVVPNAMLQSYGGLVALEIPAGKPLPYIAVETGSRQAMMPLVLAGAGITFLPRGLAKNAASLGLVTAELDPPIVQSILLVQRPGPLSPAARAFRDLALAHADENHGRSSTPSAA